MSGRRPERKQGVRGDDGKATVLRAVALALIASFVSTAALGSETWECSFHLADGPPGVSSKAVMEVDKDDLKWTWPGYAMPSMGSVGSATEKFMILENNDFGLVAASPQARKDKSVGPIVSAVVIVLNKSNGAIHEGSVWLNGQSDAFTGACHRK